MATIIPSCWTRRAPNTALGQLGGSLAAMTEAFAEAITKC
jgi:hypothetical protein